MCAMYLIFFVCVSRKANYYFLGRVLEGIFWIMGSNSSLWVVTTSLKLVLKPVKFHLPGALIPSWLRKALLGPHHSGGVKVLFFFHLESLPGQFVPILPHILFGRREGKLSHNFQIHLNFSLSPRHLVERRQQCCRLVRCTNKNKIKLKNPQPSCKKSAILRKPLAFQLEHKQLLI